MLRNGSVSNSEVGHQVINREFSIAKFFDYLNAQRMSQDTEEFRQLL